MWKLTMTLTYLIVLTSLVGCKNAENVNIAGKTGGKNQVGCFKMGLLGYKIIDSTLMKKDAAEFMMSTMKSNYEYEYIFDDNTSASVYYNKSGAVSRREIDNKKTKQFIMTIEGEKEKYLTQIDLNEMLAKVSPMTEEDSIEMSKMIKIHENDQKEILGFKCKKMTIGFQDNPTDNAGNYFTAYVAEEVPFITSSMGPMSKFFKGMPLEVEMNVGGLMMHYGATAFEYNENKRKLLEVNLNEYKKVSEETYKKMKINN